MTNTRTKMDVPSGEDAPLSPPVGDVSASVFDAGEPLPGFTEDEILNADPPREPPVEPAAEPSVEQAAKGAGKKGKPASGPGSRGGP